MHVPNAHREVLKELDRLLRNDVLWALTGSTSFALQGLQIEPHDVDIQTTRDGAYEIERRLARHGAAGVHIRESATMQSHFGLLKINQVQVEIMGDVRTRLPDGGWTNSLDLAHHRLFVEFDGLTIPVVDLVHEEQAYRCIGRQDRADEIRRFLAERR